MTISGGGVSTITAAERTPALGPVSDYSEAPVVVFWETTRACALKCRHCRAVAQPLRHPLELTTQEGFRLLEDLAAFDPPPIVILTGGDPFMRRDLMDLLGHGIELGLRMSISPSVTKLVNSEALAVLKRLGISRISFSLDGSTDEIHDNFRGVKGSFQQTLGRMQLALDAGLSLQINTTVSRHNFNDLAGTVDLLCGFPKVVLWDLFFLVPTGRAMRDDVLSPEEHEDVYNWLAGLGGSVPFGIKTTLGQPYRRVVFQTVQQEGSDTGESWSRVARTSTNDGKGICFVSHVGAVQPSGFLPLARGNVRRDSVLDLYRTDPVFVALRDPDRLSGKCGQCPFRAVCGGCRARAYALTGDYLGADPTCAFVAPNAGLVDSDVS